MKNKMMLLLVAVFLAMGNLVQAAPILEDWELKYAGYDFKPIDSFTVGGFYHAYLDFANGNPNAPDTGDTISLSAYTGKSSIFFNLLAYNDGADVYSTGLPTAGNTGFYIKSPDLSGTVQAYTANVLTYILTPGATAQLMYQNTPLADFQITSGHGQNSDAFSTLSEALGTYWLDGEFIPLLAGVFFDKDGKDLFGQSYLTAHLTGDIKYTPQIVLDAQNNPIAESVNIAAPGTLTVATPEPASMILLGAGLLGLFAARRRKSAN